VVSSAPMIVDVTPSEGSCLGGQVVELTLDHFKPFLLVIFGDQEAPIKDTDPTNKCSSLFHLSDESCGSLNVDLSFFLFRRIRFGFLCCF